MVYTVKIKTASNEQDIVAATYSDSAGIYLVVRNELSGFYLNTGYSDSYNLYELKQKKDYKPIYKGESVTLQF